MKLCLVSVLLIFFIIDSNGIPTSPDNEIPVKGRKVTVRNIGCRGGDSCCTPNNKCYAGEGDCDRDNDCDVGLRCGTDNCDFDGLGLFPYSKGWDMYDDCCYKPPFNNASLFVII